MSHLAPSIGHPADMHVLIAGGVGITPIMSVIRTLADLGDKRPVMLLYGSKDWIRSPFARNLRSSRRGSTDGHSCALGSSD